MFKKEDIIPVRVVSVGAMYVQVPISLFPEIKQGDMLWIGKVNDSSFIIGGYDMNYEFMLCRSCGEVKPSTEFGVTPHSKISTVCRECYNNAQTKAKKHHRSKFPERDLARKTLTYALYKRKVTPGKCVISGCEETTTEGHHPDYKKYDEVCWLCPKHHRMVDNGIMDLPPNINMTKIPPNEKSFTLILECLRAANKWTSADVVRSQLINLHNKTLTIESVATILREFYAKAIVERTRKADKNKKMAFYYKVTNKG